MTFPKPFFRWRPHPWHGLEPGPAAPSIVNAYIELTPFDTVKYELDKETGEVLRNPDGTPKAKTSHTLNPVPFLYYDNQTPGTVAVRGGGPFGLANLTATIVNLLGYATPEAWEPGILEFAGSPVST